MRLCALLGIGLCVCAAVADIKTLDLWLSTNSNVASLPAIENPVLPVGYAGKVYLYARSVGTWQTVATTYQDGNGLPRPWTYTGWDSDVWNLSVASIASIGFSGSIVNLAANGMWRYHPASDLTWANNDQFTCGGHPWIGTRCVGGAAPPNPGTPGTAAFDEQQACTVSPVPGNTGAVYTRLGSITISSAPAGATLFMTVGTQLIDPNFDDDYNDLVHFGAGDPAVFCGEEGSVSLLPDMTVIPEPSALTLLGLAMLALRRR